MNVLVNFVGFQACWFACVMGAGAGYPMLGPLVTAVWVGFHVGVSKARGREAAMIAIAGAFGTLVDTLLPAYGLYRFAGPPLAGSSCPLWITALWMAFATTLHSSLGWLAGRPVLAAVLGAIAGPASYYAGVRLGAVRFAANPALSAGAVAIAWGIALPGLLEVARRMGGKR